MNRRKSGRLWPRQLRDARRVPILLTVAAVAYLAAMLLRALCAPVKTVEATAYSAGRVLTGTGWLIRQEQALTAGEFIAPLLADGQRVGAGQALALSYASQAAMDAQAELEEVARAQSLLDAEPTQSPAESARLLAGSAQSGDLLSAASAGRALRAALSGSGAERESARAALAARAEALEAQAVTTVLTAPASGYFAAACDGLESVLTPEAAEALTLETLEALPAARAPDGAYGRLVTADTWFLAVPARAGLLTAGETVEVVLDDSLTLTMTVARSDADGLLLLESTEKAAQIAALRQVTARLTFHMVEGLLIPTQAVRQDENGEDGVYVAEAGVARWKSIDILQRDGESCVVALDTSDTGCLWPGDEVILTEQEIYDGKVVG